MRRILPAIVIVLAAALLYGCGYSFVGASAKLPEGIETVHVRPFTNATSETGIERIFTDELVSEISDRKAPRLVSPDKADGVIEGRVVGLSVEDISHSGVRVTSEARLTVTLSVTLKRNSDGTVIWRDSGLIQREDYPVSSSPSLQQERRRQAYMEAAKKLAETIYLRMFSGF